MQALTPISTLHDQCARPIRRIALTLPQGMYEELHDYLFHDSSKEYACYLLCGHRLKNGTLTLFGCTLVLPEPEEYESHSLVSVRIKRPLLVEVLKECERLGLSLVDIHSHPFANDSVGFSSVDEADEIEKATWFSTHIPQCFYGSIVMGQRSHRARIRAVGGVTCDLEMKIRSVSCPIQLRSPSASKRKGSLSAFSRQIQAFGREGQVRMADARVAVVGVGGLGSGLAINLARLGVRNFTLVDPDCVEMHNLNRLSGMTRADGVLGLKKVDIISRELLAIDPTIVVKRLPHDVRHPSVWRKLLDVDLIVSATDNHASRLFLNILSHQYFVPQVSIGALIESRDGRIDGAFGHVALVLPSQARPCLVCSKLIDPVEAYYEHAAPEHRLKAAKEGYIKNFQETAPAVVHLNGVLINLALVEIHNLLHGFKDPQEYILYDLLEQQIYHVALGTDKCAICGSGGGYFGRGDLVRIDNFFQEFQT